MAPPAGNAAGESGGELHFICLLQSQELVRFAGLACRSKDCPLVVFKHLQPALNVSRVSFQRCRSDADFSSSKSGSKFGNQFLEGVSFIPKASGKVTG